MKTLIFLVTIFLVTIFSSATFSGTALATSPTPDDQATTTTPLFETISALDSAVFDAFNKCSSPDQLKIHANYFSPDVEFYHDTGGVTWTRQEMIANTEKNVCGNFRRELIPGTLKVYPIKDFGAISQGSHRFCQFETGNCDGLADFTVVWSNKSNSWRITRVLSYGHRSSNEQ